MKSQMNLKEYLKTKRVLTDFKKGSFQFDIHMYPYYIVQTG